MKRVFLFACVIFSSVAAFSQLRLTADILKLNNVFSAITNLYVDSVDERKLVETAIVAALKDLDPHSSYIPKEEVEKTNEPLEGSFEGVGIQFQIFNDTILVVQTITGTPAEKVGVKPGDRIVYIDGELIAGQKIQNSDVTKRLRGKKGSEVEVKILRRGVPELILFKIIRDKIPVNSIDASYMIDEEIGYIKINNFGSKTIDEYKAAFFALKKEGMKHLILNLQGNGGGYLNAAIELADEFLSRDKLIVYTEGLRQRRMTSTATAIGGFEQGKLIILVDEYSASASEIVSGAVQDWDRGIIVGRRTFGKGLVQRQIPLSDGSMLRLTTSRYYTPSGRSIQKPYNDGVEKYRKDLADRYEHGEMQHIDSIHFSDSLKYTTNVLKRTVYGGGGIMPDVFVPLDTTRFTDFHRKIVAQGVMNKIVVEYIDRNRNSLKRKYRDFEQYKNSFSIGTDFLDQIKEMAEQEGIVYDEEQYNRSKDLISLQLKALIARDIWSMNEYYRIMDAENEALQRAVHILRNPDEYSQILSKNLEHETLVSEFAPHEPGPRNP